MTWVSGVRRWAVASNERAVDNARAAATECSRRRVERAEVEQFLAAYGVPGLRGEPARSTVEATVKAAFASH